MTFEGEKSERDDAIPARLDLTGLKCPLPALRTAKALKQLAPGAMLEVHCTDPLAIIDIPNLVRQTGDMITVIEQSAARTVFLIEKSNRPIDDIDVPAFDDGPGNG